MPRLFSYCLLHDMGSAPNPFWDICTLNICKPKIRKVAKVGDWVVGTGSKACGLGNRVIYAMEITQVLSMKEYAAYCSNELHGKIPKWHSKTYIERLGDSIYDFSCDPPKLLDSIHGLENMKQDLGGANTLLSDHFYYFGSQAEPLPEHLLPIVKQGVGYQSNINQPYFHDFVEWITKQVKAKNKVYSEPFGKLKHDDKPNCSNMDDSCGDLEKGSC